MPINTSKMLAEEIFRLANKSMERQDENLFLSGLGTGAPWSTSAPPITIEDVAYMAEQMSKLVNRSLGVPAFLMSNSRPPNYNFIAKPPPILGQSFPIIAFDEAAYLPYDLNFEEVAGKGLRLWNADIAEETDLNNAATIFDELTELLAS